VPGVLPTPAAPPVAVAKEKKAPAEDRNVAPRDQFAQVPKPMPEPNRSEATVVAPSIVIAEESKRVAVVNTLVAAAPVAEEAAGFVAAPLAAGVITANKDNATANTALAKRETAPDGRSAGSLASAGASVFSDVGRQGYRAYRIVDQTHSGTKETWQGA